MSTITSLSTSDARTIGELLRDAADGLGAMLVGAVDAVAGAVGATVNHAPAAIGAVANAAADAVSGINGAVADFSAGISAPAPAASNPFASLDLGGALAGLKSCSMNNNSLCELGDMSPQLSQYEYAASGRFNVGLR